MQEPLPPKKRGRPFKDPYAAFWQRQPIQQPAEEEQEKELPSTADLASSVWRRNPKSSRVRSNLLRPTREDLQRFELGDRTLLWTRADAAQRKRKRKRQGEPEEPEEPGEEEGNAKPGRKPKKEDPTLLRFFELRYPDSRPDPTWPADPAIDVRYALYRRRRMDRERQSSYRARKRAALLRNPPPFHPAEAEDLSFVGGPGEQGPASSLFAFFPH
jgi:hypothetical protein